MSGQDHDRGSAREDLCRFLAACFYEPCREFEEEKLFDSMALAASRLDASLAEHAGQLARSFSIERAEGLLPDYVRLFLGPPSPLAAPYASVWLDEHHQVMGASTYEALALYQELRFELDDSFRDAPDHIAAELEFLYLILFRENEARRDGDCESLRQVADIKHRFVNLHLARWIEPFASAIAHGAQSTFYRELARLTAAFVRIQASGGAQA